MSLTADAEDWAKIAGQVGFPPLRLRFFASLRWASTAWLWLRRV
jgi:hypothetical protein